MPSDEPAKPEQRSFQLTPERELSSRHGVARAAILIYFVTFLVSAVVMCFCTGFFAAMAVCAVVALIWGSSLQRLLSVGLLLLAVVGFVFQYSAEQHTVERARHVQQLHEQRTRHQASPVIEAMKVALKKLLNKLDAISKDHEEVGDTDVREQMFEAVYHGFIVQTPGYTLPTKFGMFEPAGDAEVRAALSEFIPAAGAVGISTPQQRFAAFQDGSVLSDAGHPYDEYFGHSDSFDELSKAMSHVLQRPP